MALAFGWLCAATMGCGEATRHREEPQQNSAASEASATGAPLIPPARPICDGSDAFTFGLLNLANQAGAGLDLAWRNGFHYLRVDGHCHYFAYARLRNDAVVTGSLTEAEATAEAAGLIRIREMSPSDSIIQTMRRAASAAE